MIASSTSSELAKSVEYLKYENGILRSRLPSQVHATTQERQMLLKLGKVIGRAIEELIAIVNPAPFYRWMRDESAAKPKAKKQKGGQRNAAAALTCFMFFGQSSGLFWRVPGEPADVETAA